MYTGLLHTHALLRYVVLILLIVVIVRTLSGWLSGKPFKIIDDKLSLYAFISVHVQLLIGLILYFISPRVNWAAYETSEIMKDTEMRYWHIEHISVMIIGIAVITVGRILAKKALTEVKKHKLTFIFYTIGLIIILSRIPFPFTTVSRNWLPF
ncbi:MAG: cytochrome B [Chitinophagaceae bacterium]|nr:MAG: cytochrome B [Chitinophagaceae bacterium]